MVTIMDHGQLKKIIETNFKKIGEINTQTKGELPDAVNEVINLLDQGKIRVAEKKNNEWVTNEWIKQAILLSFKTNEMELLKGPYATWWDKVPGKTANWSKEDHEKAGFRYVPNGAVRKGSYIGKNVVLMPCFVNTGAYVGDNTMLDTFSRAGSCAQIGSNCHISAGSGVGGVLEPAQALPTIIENNVFVGAMSEVVEGVIVEEGSVLSMGCYIGQSTKIVNKSTGEILKGKVPRYSVVVPGTYNDLYAVHIIKTVDEKTRSKTSINELLRN